MNKGHLVAAYIFGSAARQQHDAKSDLDILAIVETGRGKVSENSVTSLIPAGFQHLKPSISWYGTERLREMFANGELFSWHLCYETEKLSDPNGFLKSLGEPAEYMDCLEDIKSFHSILQGIPTQIRASDANAVYEAGLIYVCLRNIAMSASWHLSDKPDFSRFSPFKLRDIRSCPVAYEEYELSMECRMASQRGFSPPSGASRDFVIGMFNRLDPWIYELQSRLQKEEAIGRIDETN